MFFLLNCVLILLQVQQACSKEYIIIYTKKSHQSITLSAFVTLHVKSQFNCLKYCVINDACISAKFLNNNCTLYESRIKTNNSVSCVFIRKRILPTTIIDSFELLNQTETNKIIQDHKSIVYILPSVFNGKANIKHISLINNLLVSLDEMIFEELINLEILVLSFNRFEKVGAFLRPLERLNYLSFKKNKISLIDDEQFKNLTNLKKLFLEENLISELKQNAFLYLDNLEFLNISLNKISQIHNETFKNLRNLKYLDLSKNNIAKLDRLLFADLIKLETLSISNNYLKDIYFENVNNLKILILTNNLIEYFRTNLTSLKILYLNNNPLRFLNYSIAFKNESYKLEAIHLVNCNLNLITREAFQNFYSLNHIELKLNNNLEIEENIFAILSNLIKIDLDNHLRNFTFHGIKNNSIHFN